MTQIVAHQHVWDTHVHIFEPSKYPYKVRRAYTPPTVSPTQLIERYQANNFMLVQATVEDGSSGLIETLQLLSKQYLSRKFRGTMLFGKAEIANIEQWTPEDLGALHKIGIRCLRIHGKLGDVDGSAVNVVKELENLLLKISPTVKRYNLAISMQLPLQVWAALTDFLAERMSEVTVIAEHCASISVPETSIDSSDFKKLCWILEKKLIYIKLGALHRRVQSHEDLANLRGLLTEIAKAGPTQLLWGSDWPHVNSTAQNLDEADCLKVDEREELRFIKESVKDIPGAFDDMLEATPERLFA